MTNPVSLDRYISYLLLQIKLPQYSAAKTMNISHMFSKDLETVCGLNEWFWLKISRWLYSGSHLRLHHLKALLELEGLLTR